jgi:hypothetical protein
MGAHFMYHHFFGDAGLRYLETFILPLVNDICAHSTLAPLEADDYRAPKGTDTKANLQVVLDVVNKFLTNIYDATLLCPLLIRMGLLHMQGIVHNAYQETSTTRITISVFMLRFICPAIISPHKYGLLEEAPLKNAGPGLILSAKILQSIANGIEWSESEMPHVKTINRFIRKQIPRMGEFMEKLWNSDEIERGFRMFESSVARLFNAEEQQQALEALHSYLEMKESFFEVCAHCLVVCACVCVCVCVC